MFTNLTVLFWQRKNRTKNETALWAIDEVKKKVI